MSNNGERRRNGGHNKATKTKENPSTSNIKKRHNSTHPFSRRRETSSYLETGGEEQTVSSSQQTLRNFFGKAKIILKFPKRIIITLVALLLIIPIIIITMALTIFSKEDEYVDGGFATGDYYSINCEDITVKFADKKNNYEITNIETYPLEDYVACVVNGEVSEFNNLEVYKEYAIAARTYVANHIKNRNTCTVESSDRFQVCRPSPNALMRQAAEETKGQVLLNKEGELMQTEYDAFCSIAVDENYYTINQKNQKIPRTWVDDTQKGRINDEWKTGNCTGNHGRGSSQWGSFYLATEKGYNYGELLNYYYSTDNNKISISSNSFAESIANLEIKNTTNAAYTLDKSIENFLASKGSSLADYNNYIKKSVSEAGYGTRAGVVTAAVSMINYLYDNFNTKLPYYWGGSSDMTYGLSQNIGKNIPSSPSVSGKRYPTVSFDCSGFTSWALKNAGYNVYRMTVTGFDNLAGRSNMCRITNSSCVGKPGDFISYKEQHIKMIVSVDEPNNKYYVAESTTSGVIITTQPMHASGSVETNILHMDSFYNNPNNVNHNY